MKVVLETIQDGAAYLEKRGVEHPRLNMEHLLASVLGCRRMQLYLWFDRPLAESELVKLRELTIRRGKREPLQHLLGTAEFHGREFKCDARALIPRPETEELVEKIIAKLKGGVPPRRILDMGSGSGVIGLTLAATWPEADVVLADISPGALKLAQENAVALDLADERIRFVLTDLFANLAAERFDLIMANLPYISPDELPGLAPEVQRDPHSALDGGGDGTALIRNFIKSAPAQLSPAGKLALEVGAGQTEALTEALRAAGFQQVEVQLDLSGRDRFLFAEQPQL